jgi:hypothetical protein
VVVRFEEIFGNEDDRGYHLAQEVIAKKHLWLEEGIAGWEGKRR